MRLLKTAHRAACIFFLAISVLLGAMMVVNCGWYIRWDAGTSVWSLSTGAMHFGRQPARYSMPGLRVGGSAASFHWLPGYKNLAASYGPGTYAIWIPYWMPMIAAIVIAGLIRRAEQSTLRREAQVNCVKCGYLRAGLADEAVCPECGAAPFAR